MSHIGAVQDDGLLAQGEGENKPHIGKIEVKYTDPAMQKAIEGLRNVK